MITGKILATFITLHVLLCSLCFATDVDTCYSSDSERSCAYGLDGVNNEAFEVEATDDYVLMQTAHRMQMLRSQTSDVSSKWQERPEPVEASSYRTSTSACTGNYMLDLMSYDPRYHFTSVPSIANFTIRRDCTPDPPISLLKIIAAQPYERPASPWPARIVLITYVTFVLLFLVYLCFTGLTKSDTTPWVEEQAKTRPEQIVYNRSFMRWIMISWVDTWIAHWGNPKTEDDLQIPARSLGGIGWKEDESVHVAARLEMLWKEESKRNGTFDLVRVMLRYIGCRKLVVICTMIATYQTILFLGPALAIRQVVPILKEFHFRYHISPSLVTTADCFWPSLRFIAIFTGGGLVMFFCDVSAFLMLSRINVQIRGGLNALCYSKAQRLHGNNVDFDVPAVGDWPPQKYSFETLINVDVNTGMNGIFLGCFNIAFFIPMTFVLCYMLAVQIKEVAVITLATQAFLLLLLVFSCVMISYKIFSVGILQHARVMHTREFFQGIRIIKSYAWEEASYNILNTIRRNEVEAMRVMFAWSQLFYVLTFFNPRILFFVTLVCYVAIYGDISALTIFTLMQLLRAFNNAQREMTNTIPNVARIYPSVVRLQCFLRLPDCDKVTRIGGGQVASEPSPQLMPAWADPEASGRQRKIKARIKGSFSWREDLAATLKHIDLEVYEGELVGVVGEVGSGKTALLSALLGELYPSADASVDVPDRVAYHAQVPLISEGSLRDNVIFWREVDEKRYETVLHDACLLHDLQFLPGGDLCSIGHKGIVLSGGQRARVSLARMAYTTNSDLMIVDDPFSSVDMETADHLLKHLFLGAQAVKKTRVVVTQPDMDRLQHFDRVIVVAHGKIVAQGSPKDIEQLKQFKDLLKEEEDGATVIPATKKTPRVGITQLGVTSRADEVQNVRDDEHEGRANWKTISYFMGLGGWWNAFFCTALYGLLVLASLLSDVTLAQWGSAELHDVHRPGTFLIGYSLWALVSLFFWFPLWYCCVSWSLNVSKTIFGTITKNLLAAPVDKFHDRHPLGRILNRVSTDLSMIDMITVGRLVSTMGMIWNFGIPLLYMHSCVPLWVTFAIVPVYFVILVMLRRYWFLMVALRYLSATTRSKLSAYVGDTGSMRSTLRAYGVVSHLERETAIASDEIVRADFATVVARKWLILRWGFMYIIILTLLVLLNLWLPGVMSVGTCSLLVSCIVGFMIEIEYSLEMATGVQYELINMNRIHEYTVLPSERPSREATDSTYSSFFVKLKRTELGSIKAHWENDCIQILRHGRVLFKETRNGLAFQLGPDIHWKDLSQFESHPDLEECGSWHQLVGAGFEGTDPVSMARVLCNGTEPEVTLCIRSDWLADGARLTVKDLQAGYSKFPNTLHDITLDIAPMSKVAIMGPTGCGKSTFLQCLLRILEPRGGSIMVNGVDTTSIGLTTLRTMFGLVPQEPILFSGPLRNNLDPFEQHSDDRVWNALTQVKLESQLVAMAFPKLRAIEKGKEVSQMRACLALGVRAEGDNFSFGQRQLLCIARMILRQPAVLLLDECTSAIDPRTQQLVQESIRKGFPRSTTIAIAHRLETIMDFDKAIVFESGRRKKIGCPRNFKGPDELLEWATSPVPEWEEQEDQKTE